MKIEEYVLPEHWLPALVNDDETGLSDAESWALYSFVKRQRESHDRFHCLGPKDDSEPAFMTYHDAHQYGVLACNAVTVCFDVGDE